ncbi:MAG TPA: acyltransferase family protein [Polyangiales bacterium]
MVYGEPADRADATAAASDHWSVSIEGLRGVAILLLVISHIGFMGLPTRLGGLASRVGRMGWFGTDLFLAIAGYLCAKSLMRREAHTVATWLQYLGARARRVLPSYFLFLLVYLYALPALWPHLLPRIPMLYPYQSLTQAQGPAAPYLLTAAADLFYAFSGTGIGAALEALFAIGVGAQATLLVSASMVFWRGRARLALLLGFVVLAHGTRLLLLAHPWPYVIYANPITRMEPFAWGALVALCSSVPAALVQMRRWAPVVAWSGWAAVAVVSALTHSLDIHATATKLLGYPLVAMSSAASVAAVTLRTRTPELLRRLASLAPIVYAMYFFKLPWLSSLWGWITPSRLSQPTQLVVLLLLAIAGLLGLSLTWYVAVERPLLNWLCPRRRASSGG